jgi:hypothetical protein
MPHTSPNRPPRCWRRPRRRAAARMRAPRRCAWSASQCWRRSSPPAPSQTPRHARQDAPVAQKVEHSVFHRGGVGSYPNGRRSFFLSFFHARQAALRDPPSAMCQPASPTALLAGPLTPQHYIALHCITLHYIALHDTMLAGPLTPQLPRPAAARLARSTAKLPPVRCGPVKLRQRSPTRVPLPQRPKISWSLPLPARLAPCRWRSARCAW